jgi:transposase
MFTCTRGVTRRPKYACRSCSNGVVQAPAPALLIRGGMPTKATVAHVLPLGDCFAFACRVTDETRAPVLDPKAGKTKTGYFWALARDDRPWGGVAPPGVVFTYAPGRSGQYANDIWQGFTSILQVRSHGLQANHCRATDGYAGYNRLIQPDRAGPAIQLAYCWAHARRKLFEVARNSTAPIAEDGLKRIA